MYTLDIIIAKGRIVMKKILVATIAMLTVLFLLTGLCACDAGDSEHTHDYRIESKSAEYIKSEAGCTSGTVIYYSCLCGEAGEETFELDNKTHDITRVYTDTNTLYHTTKTTCRDCAAVISEVLEFHEYSTSKKCAYCNHAKKKDEFAAGLYKSGSETLLYSWDELVSEGILSVVGEYTNVSVYCNKPELLMGDLIVSDEITVIPNMAFMCCTNLTRICLPSAVKNIGSYAFADCDALENISFSESLESIGSHAFYSCDSFTSVVIPSSVKTVEGFAFANCKNVTSVNVLGKIETLGPSAFMCMSDLTSVSIPSSIKTIRENVFMGCTVLTCIDYDGTVEEWNAISKNVYWAGYPNEYRVVCSDGVVTE